MKKYIIIAALALAGAVYAAEGHAPGSNYMESGGKSFVVGGTLNIASGGALKINGTQITATAA